MRTKKVRSRKTAEYIKRSFFRHNDRNLPEHYVDNFTRKIPTMECATEQLVLVLGRFSQQLDRIPGGIEEDEKKRLISAIIHTCGQLRATYEILAIHGMKAEYDSENKPMPRELKIFWNRVVDAEKCGEQIQHLINKMSQANPSIGTDYAAQMIINHPLVKEMMHLYGKYLRPMRLIRNKKRNKLLSEAHFGSEKNRYDDYRGLG